MGSFLCSSWYCFGLFVVIFVQFHMRRMDDPSSVCLFCVMGGIPVPTWIIGNSKLLLFVFLAKNRLKWHQKWHPSATVIGWLSLVEDHSLAHSLTHSLSYSKLLLNWYPTFLWRRAEKMLLFGGGMRQWTCVPICFSVDFSAPRTLFCSAHVCLVPLAAMPCCLVESRIFVTQFLRNVVSGCSDVWVQWTVFQGKSGKTNKKSFISLGKN